MMKQKKTYGVIATFTFVAARVVGRIGSRVSGFGAGELRVHKVMIGKIGDDVSFGWDFVPNTKSRFW